MTEEHLAKWNGNIKWLVTTAVTILLLVAGWTSTATSMKEKIKFNTERISTIKEDISEIKQDVKELLKR